MQYDNHTPNMAQVAAETENYNLADQQRQVDPDMTGKNMVPLHRRGCIHALNSRTKGVDSIGSWNVNHHIIHQNKGNQDKHHPVLRINVLHCWRKQG